MFVASGVIICAAAASSWRVLAQTPPLRPGEYDVTTEFSMTSRPAKMPAQKSVRCYTTQDIQDLPRRIGARAGAEGCKVETSKMTGTTLTFATECPAPMSITSTGTITFTSPESFQAEVTTKDTSGRAGNPVLQGTMTANVTAKRIGECKK